MHTTIAFADKNGEQKSVAHHYVYLKFRHSAAVAKALYCSCAIINWCFLKIGCDIFKFSLKIFLSLSEKSTLQDLILIVMVSLMNVLMSVKLKNQGLSRNAN